MNRRVYIGVVVKNAVDGRIYKKYIGGVHAVNKNEAKRQFNNRYEDKVERLLKSGDRKLIFCTKRQWTKNKNELAAAA